MNTKPTPGRVFHDLTVIENAPPLMRSTGQARIAYLCRCICGATIVVPGDKLLSGNTKSCGCRRVRRKANYRHGGCKTQLYVMWSGIKSRCQNPGNSHYSSYGGRGIALCSEWQKFPAFKEWADTTGYDGTLTIERKDTNGNYCPENCTWIPLGEQSKNTRFNLRIAAFGETKILNDWVSDPRCSVTREAIRHRLKKLGWPPEQAISAPRMFPPH